MEFNALLSHIRLAKQLIVSEQPSDYQPDDRFDGALGILNNLDDFLVRISNKAHGRFLSKSQGQYFNERIRSLVGFAGQFERGVFPDFKRCLVACNHIMFKQARDEYEIANGNGTTSAATGGV